MAITFNSSVIDSSRTGLYAHIVDVSGPHKIDADSSWYTDYYVVIHTNEEARRADNGSWTNRLPTYQIWDFKWTGANLGTYPTLAVLYGHLKTQITSVATSIADSN